MRSHTGVIGVVLVIISALSFARALQRLFERVWEQDHRGGVAGAQRCLVWLAGWVVYLQLVVTIIASLDHPLSFSALGIILQIGAGTALWWWTAHTLLLGRVPWRSLWLGAALTATGLAVMVRLSRFVMPPYTEANIEQFGSLGVVFAASTWLLVFGGVIVLGATFGRVIIEDPVLRQAIATSRTTTPRSHP
ncbi:YhjD/YihY/BrkB family envelope integrity protein [Aeromicrobium sp. UC242_57]|uniref:YhjD/YihY/BrkB family envelope integrity protein n=1 Tax=Aeromicrobium sp. UC242_57 TaxID=3374624 RepID=UPI0037A1AA82